MNKIIDKLKKHKKIILIVFVVILFLFCVVNVFWYAFRDVEYSRYTENMEESACSSFIVPDYIGKDDDGFTYSVAYPTYLGFTGNMAVSFPSADDENPYTDSLIIWPLLKGGYEYGAILYIDNVQYQIYVDKNGNAINEEDDSIVSECSQSISTLLEKADTMWNIE
jgi:hypothetical protein